MNALTDESRDARFKVDVEGFCATLRTPESIHRLVMEEKPAGFPVGDFALTSMVNDLITSHMVRRDYRAIQGLLGTLFGAWVPDVNPADARPASGHGQVPNGTSRSPMGTNGTSDRKPLAKIDTVPDAKKGAAR